MEEAPKKLNTKAYTITIKKKEALNQWLDKQLKTRLIVESKSRYAVPCFYIPKKDRSLQLVQDYRKLNQVTIKDKTLLPLIGEVINKLKKTKYFNKLDCQDCKKWTWFLFHFSYFLFNLFFFFLFLAFRVSNNIGHIVHRRV